MSAPFRPGDARKLGEARKREHHGVEMLHLSRRERRKRGERRDRATLAAEVVDARQAAREIQKRLGLRV